MLFFHMTAFVTRNILAIIRGSSRKRPYHT
jgi:hypothetical protein